MSKPQLHRGIGDPVALTKRMVARGLMSFPDPEKVAREVKMVEARRAQTYYDPLRVVDQRAPLAERTIKQKKYG